MRNTMFIIGCTIISSIYGSLPVHAFSPKELPISQSSDHWKVTIDTPDEDDMEINKDDMTFDRYSVNVKNIGEKFYDAKVEIYQDEPNTRTMHEIFSAEIPKTQDFFQHQNQAIAAQSKKVIVVVTWREKPNEFRESGKKDSTREFKQTFTFEQ